MGYAIAVGELMVTPAIFWAMTPRELFLAADHRREIETVRITVTAWKTAYYDRIKKLPDLNGEVLAMTKVRKLKETDVADARNQLELYKKFKAKEKRGLK